MTHDPFDNRQYVFRNIDKRRRKIITRRDLLPSEQETFRSIIRNSQQTQEEAHFEDIKLIWLDDRFRIGDPFYCWGLTMEERDQFARIFGPMAATRYEVHGQLQGFMYTQQMRPVQNDLFSRELAKAGGA